ncbi:MAG: TonB C-terminal domain-containing protein [Deltaproteobacteria bacterium]|jgi:colicin import membrane protein|nr:TonB C-terminal domain-containing protein [Deltaproteobacteria bacterium]MBW2491548.1 TonB C-terminal domain-containing protein [Deltaproteobacteria bacterium]
MNKKTYPHTYQDEENEHRIFFSNFAVSLLCHLLFFVILIFAPGYATDRNPSLSVINVSLVTLPSQNNAPSPAEVKTPSAVEIKDQEATISSKTIPKTDPESPESISLEPKKKKVKQSLKKKTFKTDRIVKSAINRIKQEVEESRPDQVNKAIARLKDQVEKTGPPDLSKQQNTKETGRPGGTDAGRKKDLKLMDIYLVEIAYRIQKNWSFNEQLAGGRSDLEAWAAIKVMPNGEIKDTWFDKRSGNSYFDEQAKKAILKSNPLPPLPKGYFRPYFEAGFHFTSSGISQ